MDIYYLCKTRYWLVTSGSVTAGAGLQQRSRVIKLSADPGAELVAGSWVVQVGRSGGGCWLLHDVASSYEYQHQHPPAAGPRTIAPSPDH